MENNNKSIPSSNVVWLNGTILPLEEACIRLDDAALTSAAMVTERLRTFRHELFQWEAHARRLRASAEASFIDVPMSDGDLEKVVGEVLARNARHVPLEDDLTISIWLSAAGRLPGTLCIRAEPIPAARYLEGSTAGLRLVVPPTEAVAPESLAPAIKTRNRLHWHIANRQAERIEPGAQALLMTREGFVTETAAANVFAVKFDQLATPRRQTTLAGISQQYVIDLAERLGLPVMEKDLCVEDFLAADEVFATSSVACLQPVVRINQQSIGTGFSGPVCRRLLTAWSEAVGVDIVGQIRRMAGGELGKHKATP